MAGPVPINLVFEEELKLKFGITEMSVTGQWHVSTSANYSHTI
jgi:hypothetical protein